MLRKRSHPQLPQSEKLRPHRHPLNREKGVCQRLISLFAFLSGKREQAYSKYMLCAQGSAPAWPGLKERGMTAWPLPTSLPPTCNHPRGGRERREHPSFHTHPSQAACLPGLHSHITPLVKLPGFQGSSPYTFYPFLSGLEEPGAVPLSSSSEGYNDTSFPPDYFEGSQPSWDLLLPTPKTLFLGPVGLLTPMLALGAAQPSLP